MAEIIKTLLITKEVQKRFPKECENDTLFPIWFVATADIRSGLNPKFSDGNGKCGLFALRNQLFQEFAIRLGLDIDSSIFDPNANTKVAVEFIRWCYERFENSRFNQLDRLLLAILSLEVGYFRIKRAISQCSPPHSLPQILDVLGNERARNHIIAIISKYWEYCLAC